jgi:uncharacterized protein (DUF924 family)
VSAVPQSIPAQWSETVLDFWFRELPKDAWFTKSDATDALIRERFLTLHADLMRYLPPEARTNPRAALAAIIVFDQFPRNMFRGTPQAFATDPLALDLAKNAVEAGFDRNMTKDERLFLYLPFEHSEHPDDQRECVALYKTLGDAELLGYAEAHKVIIDRFGRFPHRNDILDRPSTAEEVEFLKGPNSSF